MKCIGYKRFRNSDQLPVFSKCGVCDWLRVTVKFRASRPDKLQKHVVDAVETQIHSPWPAAAKDLVEQSL
jgi:hypothetical protein